MEDLKQNQFVIRIFDLGNVGVSSSSSKSKNEYAVGAAVSGSNSQLERVVSPRHTYHLSQHTKKFEINSSRIRIQLVVGKNMMMDKGQLTINWVAASKGRFF